MSIRNISGGRTGGFAVEFVRRHVVLIGILAVGLLVRLWGIDFGLPYEGVTYNQLQYEESKEVHRAFKLGVGEYVWSFGKGGMYLILFLEFGVYYVLSMAMGWVTDSREFALSVLEDRTTAYMLGRVTTAVMGMLTVLVIYLLGQRIFDRRIGTIAAVLGALAYFHVQFSTVINVDIGMVLAMWASVLLYTLFEEREKMRWLIASGALGGVSIAFKLHGGIVVPLVFAAIATAPVVQWRLKETAKRCAAYSLALAATLTLIAPEWLLWARELVLGVIPQAQAATSAVEQAALDDEIFALSNVRYGISFRYLEHLVSDYNVVLTLLAVLAFGLGLWRKRRWDMLLGGVVVFYVVGMSASSWTQPERYLLPIVPALWLLGARFIVEISQGRRALLVVGLATVLAMPVWNLARAASERAGSDTRVLAKSWIEKRVPEGSRLLIDAMQHRNILGPPLNPDTSSLRRQLEYTARKIEAGEEIGRGVNKRTLALYEEAQRRIPGPRYEMHSTVHGLALESLDYYVDNCFDYVVTSSISTSRFASGSPRRELHPRAAQFYDHLPNDPRFERVHSEVAVPWRSSGPTITIYRVKHECSAPAAAGSGV